ncbi:MAG: hypothetical protein COB36_09700 [Alphaproteobacteria bacterium]|nr:MAG: hypothetical protein COB36_09700 [Alphaproteobacteria bacterium]
MRNQEGVSMDLENLQKQASDWLVLMESSDCKNSDRKNFQKWLAEKPRHREIYDEISSISHNVDILSGVYKAVPEALPDELNQLIQSRGNPDKNTKIPFLKKITAIAAVLLVSFIAFTGGNSLMRLGDNHFVTDYDGTRLITLADGSEIQLNTDTDIVVTYTDTQRHITLNKGEAYFTVAKDNNRPFVVATQQGNVRAVGTAFNINQRTAIVDVTVLEGIVEIQPQKSPSGQADLTQNKLIFGQRIRLDSVSNAIQAMDEESLRKTTAWKNDTLYFDGMKLSEIVAELNHYTSSKIIIVDASVGNIEGGGIFNTKQVDGYLNAMETALPITIVQLTPLVTLIFEKDQ